MCGFAGAVARRSGRVDVPEPALREVLLALRHRGPDGEGTFRDDAAVLAHTRLSIVDLDRGGQPMANEDGTVVVAYNGEIWNHVPLRAQLERAGHRFATAADTEVLVHGYEEWGDTLLDHVDGMFGFALWDSRRGRLLLARDRVGKKPVYYMHTPWGISFGSDARSTLLAGNRRPEVDESAVADFLFQRYVSEPRTLFAGVSKLRPGELLVYDRERVRTRRYWQLPAAHDEPMPAHELRGLLRDAVERRLMGDVPVGMLLSGGVDSAAVLGLMHEVGARRTPTFTIGFDDVVYDERPLARAAAERYDSDHHEVVVGPDDFVAALPRLAWYRDEPIAEPSEIPLLLLAEHASKHVKVVLTGDGADELFGGYPKYRAEALLRLAHVGGFPLSVAARAKSRRPSHRRFDRAAETLAIRDELVRWASWFRSFDAGEIRRLVSPSLRAGITDERLAANLGTLLEPYGGLDPARRMLAGDLLTYLPGNMLLRSDRVLMAASIEGRMPLLDAHVVQWVFRARTRTRDSLRATKALLRAAVEDLVPAATLDAPKRGFPVPLRRLVDGDRTRTLERLLLSDRTRDRGLVDPDELRALVTGERRWSTDRELKIFTVASLELWLRANVDEVRSAPPSAADLEERPAPMAAAAT